MMTYQELRRLIVNDYVMNNQRIDVLNARLKHLDAAFAGKTAADISAMAIQTYQADRLSAGAKPGTVNQELTALRRMFSIAVQMRLLPSDEKPYIKLLRLRNARKGFFELPQFEAVRRALPELYRPIVTTMYVTGWRLNEVLSRKKQHLDIAHGWLRLEPGETKNGEGRQFPLTHELETVLAVQLDEVKQFERRTGRICPWLFHRDGNEISGFRKAWESACRQAGVPGRMLHDFRRTAVRNMERAGVPRSAAMKMVGMLTEAIYKRYAIVDDRMLKEAAAKLNAQ